MHNKSTSIRVLGSLSLWRVSCSPEACEESTAARQQKERQRNNDHVAEVHRGWHEAADVHLGIEEPHRVHQQIPCTRPRRQEGTPPPEAGRRKTAEHTAMG